MDAKEPNYPEYGLCMSSECRDVGERTGADGKKVPWLRAPQRRKMLNPEKIKTAPREHSPESTARWRVHGTCESCGGSMSRLCCADYAVGSTPE